MTYLINISFCSVDITFLKTKTSNMDHGLIGRDTFIEISIRHSSLLMKIRHLLSVEFIVFR